MRIIKNPCQLIGWQGFYLYAYSVVHVTELVGMVCSPDLVRKRLFLTVMVYLVSEDSLSVGLRVIS